MTGTRVFLVDDEAMVRQGLRMIIEAEDDLEVVGEASDGGQAVHAIPVVRPDVVLMDVRMPGVDGLTATRRLLGDSRTAGRTRVVMLTTFDLDEYVFDALGAGASGFLLKNAPAADLVAGIRTVAAGDALLAPAVTRRVIAAFASRRPAADAERRVETLSEREREVMRLVAFGYTNGEIAERLVVGEATVKTHIGSILAKLGARDRVAAVIAAYASGLVGLGESDSDGDASRG
jgi:DNA-binding NarL/FixJ family response regulator